MAKTTYKLKLDLSKVPPKDRAEVKKEVGNYVLEKTLEETGRQQSIVTGRQWKRLSKDYKKLKQKVASGKANLELSGDMLDSLKFKNTRDGVEVGVFTTKQAKKADGHCHTEVFGTSKLPPRKFIPKQEEGYRPGVVKEINNIVKEFENNGSD